MKNLNITQIMISKNDPYFYYELSSLSYFGFIIYDYTTTL